MAGGFLQPPENVVELPDRPRRLSPVVLIDPALTFRPDSKPGVAVGRGVARAAAAASGSGPSAVGKLASWGSAALTLTAARACAGSQLAKRGQPPWQVAARARPALRARDLTSSRVRVLRADC